MKIRKRKIQKIKLFPISFESKTLLAQVNTLKLDTFCPSIFSYIKV